MPDRSNPWPVAWTPKLERLFRRLETGRGGGLGGSPRLDDIITKSPYRDVRADGAVVDGVTDDTTAVQATIDAVEAKVSAGIGGGSVLFPEGVCIASNLVVNTGNVQLIGQGWRATYIKAKAGTTGSIVTFDGTDYANHISYNGIRNLTIWGNGTSTTGLSLKHLNIFRADQVDVVGCLDDGFYAEQVWDATFIQFKVNSCGAAGKAAIHIYNGGETYCDQLTFYKPYLEANVGYDIWIDGSNAGGTSNNNILFNHMHLERTSGTGETLVYISGSQGAEKIRFTDSGFSGYDAAYAIHCDAGDATQVIVRGCNFWNRGDTGTAILLETGRNEVSSSFFAQWDYDIDHQNLTNPADLFMSHNRRLDNATGRIVVIGPSGSWTWSKQFDSYEPVTFADGDTTPSVAQGRIFKTANTGATTYTMLDDGSEGETIMFLFDDSNTTIDFTGTNLHGNGGVDFTGVQYDHMTGTYHGGHWYCDISDNTA